MVAGVWQAWRRWRLLGKRFERADPIERAVLDTVANLEAIMSRLGPVGPRTRRALRKLSTRLQRGVFWAKATSSSKDLGAATTPHQRGSCSPPG